MPTPGWIKLHRKIMENSLWNDKPFSRGQAWIDLIMLANYEPKDMWLDGECIKIPRGSFITSIRKLSERWGWSRMKAKRFLNALESAQMVIAKCDTKKTTITILNYEEYQGLDEDLDNGGRATKRATKKPQTSHRRDTNEPQTSITKEIKKGNNSINKESALPVSPDGDPAAALPEGDDMYLPDDIVWDDPAAMTDEEAERWIHDGHL